MILFQFRETLQNRQFLFVFASLYENNLDVNAALIMTVNTTISVLKSHSVQTCVCVWDACFCVNFQTQQSADLTS